LLPRRDGACAVKGDGALAARPLRFFRTSCFSSMDFLPVKDLDAQMAPAKVVSESLKDRKI
jgi:hypothetical protein